MSEEREIKIDLTDNYRLVYDFCGNKFLQKKAVSKNGKISYICYCGYFPKFEMLLEEFCNHRIAEMEATTIQTALKQFTNAENEMRKLAREAGRKLDEKEQLKKARSE